MSTKPKKNFVKEVENLVSKGLETAHLPITSKGVVHIDNLAVYKKNDYFYVQDLLNKKIIAKTNYRSSALCIAKQWVQGSNVVNNVKKLDDNIAKLNTDCVFYSNMQKNAKNQTTRFTADVRYQDAKTILSKLRKDLDKFIYR